VHEWSGVFKNVLLHSHFRRFRPGLRVAVNLFGGHYWRTQVRAATAWMRSHPIQPSHAPIRLLACMP
jgi:hypothetical protein